MAEFDIGLVNNLRAISGREIVVKLDNRDNIILKIEENYRELDRGSQTVGRQMVEDIITVNVE